jgi:acyl carrier protein
MEHQRESSQQSTIEKWLTNWLSEKNVGKVLTIELNENFLESGIVDSFELINLIESAERQYDIRFTQEEFLRPEFVTVSGLASVINGKL